MVLGSSSEGSITSKRGPSTAFARPQKPRERQRRANSAQDDDIRQKRAKTLTPGMRGEVDEPEAGTDHRRDWQQRELRTEIVEANIRAFVNSLRVEKGLSENTIAAYRRDMVKFMAFASERNLKTGEIERSHVVEFLASLYRRGLDSRSVARHLVTIRHFFRFALMEEYIAEDPASTIQSPKFRQSLPEFLSLAEVDRLLEQPDTSTVVGLRDRAMIELMYSCGLRVSELCGCAWGICGWRRLPAMHRQRQQGAAGSRRKASAGNCG